MGRYIEWDEVIDRYPVLNSIGGADEVSSAFIAYAEASVDGLLAGQYTVPFSSNNLTAKDLSIDYTYWMTGRFKLEDALSVYSSFHATIAMLKNGDQMMIVGSGSQISAGDANSGIYSSTQSYHSSFGPDDPLNWRIDSDWMSDVQDSRL
jgi:hypothetical protein